MKVSIWIKIKCFFGFHDWRGGDILGDECRLYGIVEDTCKNCKKKRKSKINLEDEVWE